MASPSEQTPVVTWGARGAASSSMSARLPAEDAWEQRSSVERRLLPGEDRCGHTSVEDPACTVSPSGHGDAVKAAMEMQCDSYKLVDVDASMPSDGAGGGASRVKVTAEQSRARPPRVEPYPHLARYKSARMKDRWPQPSRYFRSRTPGYSDDGHPDRWLLNNLCFMCMRDGHRTWACPLARCRLCYQMGHEPQDCPAIFEQSRMQETIAEVLSASLVDGTGHGTRCLACGRTECGNTNCAEAPELPMPLRTYMMEGVESCAEEDHAVQDEQPEGRIGDMVDSEDCEVVQLDPSYTHWSGPGAPSNNACGSGFGHKLDGAVLRFLASEGGSHFDDACREALTSASSEDILAAVGGLRRLRTLHLPAGQGLAARVNSLGQWLATLSLPPLAASVLLHGAIWGVLLPMAVLVVLTTSVPPALMVNEGSAACRSSGHYSLVSLYFRWREGRDTGTFRAFTSALFWDTVDARIVAIMKHAQESLGYEGDDAAFDEMDGELMDVRRSDARPWTLASAMGKESSERWVRFLAALCAASPPTISENGGAWISRTSFASDDVQALDTTVNSRFATLFAAGSITPVSGSSPFEAIVDGMTAKMSGGEDIFAEAQDLREGYEALIAQRVENDPMNLWCEDEEVLSRSVVFLQGPSGELSATQGVFCAHGMPHADDHTICELLKKAL